MELTYLIENILVLEKDTLPHLNKYSFDFDKYQKILNQLNSILNNNFNSSIFINKIKIKNRLSFENSSKIIAMYIDNNETKKYINARIDNKKEKIVEILFDEIEVGDTIEIFIIAYKNMQLLTLSGKTKDFDKPRHYFHIKEKINDNFLKIEQNIEESKKLILFKIFFSICMMLILLFCLYLTNNKKEIRIRNPFVIVEVQNVKK